MLEQFIFTAEGRNKRGEVVYIKDKRNLSFKSGYTSFPFIDSNNKRCGYIPIGDNYHDTSFPYSELCGTNQKTDEIAAANGITKIFLAAPRSQIDYKKGESVLIYRIHKGYGAAAYRTVVTSFYTVKIRLLLKIMEYHLWVREFIDFVGNKRVFSKDELNDWYNKYNLVIIVLEYNGYFGKGKNVNHATLKSNGFFNDYPYINKLTMSQFIKVLEMGGKNVQNIIIN